MPAADRKPARGAEAHGGPAGVPAAESLPVEGRRVGVALGQHRPHVEFARACPGQGLVAVDEEELVHAVRRRGEQVAPEAEQIAVAGVEAGDGAAPHLLYLVRNGHARDGGPSDVVVGNEERGGDRAQHADLVPHAGQVRRGRGLDFADQLEGALRRGRHGFGPSCLTNQMWRGGTGRPSLPTTARSQPVDS